MKFAPVIFLLIALGVFFLYIQPTYSGSIQELRKEIRELVRVEETAMQFKQEQARLTALKAQISDGDLARLKKFLPDNVDNVQLILDVDGIANANGVRINDIGVAEEQESREDSIGQGVLLEDQRETRGSLIISLNVTGTYEQFKRFLRSLENSLRTIDVTDITFGSSETGVYDIDMDVRVYWLQ